MFWRKLHFLGLVVILSLGHRAWAEWEWTTGGSLEDRVGVHLIIPRDLSSQYLALNVEEKFKSGDWSAVLAARGWSEAAYAIDGEYPRAIVDNDSSEVSIRDLYLQYKKDAWFVRAGQQQVVWGEAFGFFYSDIVNAKDFRDGGFRDFEQVRRPAPMLNVKYTLDQVSVQGLYIPKTFYNKAPLPGSDFGFPFNYYFPMSQVSVIREDSPLMEPENADYGGRVSYREGHLDTSVFLLSYMDRSPYYTIDSTSILPGSIVLREQHSRVVSTGLTASLDLSGYVLRFEGLQTQNRLFPALSGPSLGTFSTTEYIYVFGVDLPTWNKFTLGLQYSDDWLGSTGTGLLRNQDQNLFSARLSHPIYLQQIVETTIGYAGSDGSLIWQIEYDIPATDQLEFKFGADYFDGSNTSQYGEIHRATRAYVSAKFWFNG